MLGINQSLAWGPSFSILTKTFPVLLPISRSLRALGASSRPLQMLTLPLSLPCASSWDNSLTASGISLAQSVQMKPWMMALLMMILGQFLHLYLFWISELQELMAPQAMILLKSLMCIKSSSSISPPTLSKQTSTPLGQYSLSLSFKLSFLQSMAASAPKDFMQLHLSLEPTIATTLHPAFLANWTAIQPTPPAAPETTTVSPALRLPIFLSPKYAVNPEMPRTPRKWLQSGQFLGRGARSLALTTEYFCHLVSPTTTSPVLNLESLEQMTSATPKPGIISPGLTGSMQVLMPEIQTLLAASIERRMFLRTTSPCWTWSVGMGGTYLTWNTSSSRGYFSEGVLTRVTWGLQSTTRSPWLIYNNLSSKQQQYHALEQMFSHRFQILLSNLGEVRAVSHSILLQLPGCLGE